MTNEKQTLRRFSKERFFRLMAYKPHPGQQEIHNSSASRRAVACGVRWGKTMCAAMEGLAAAMEPRERSIGWVVGPTYDLADRVFDVISLVAMEKLRHRVVTFRRHDQRLVLRNYGGGLSEIRGKSAENPVSLLGEGLDWVIVDEAARLRPTIWEGHLSQRLLDKKGWALLISTPKGKGWFYDVWRRGQGRDVDFQSWNQPSAKNPLLDAAMIEAERARLPERVFLQEYGAQFLEGSGAVFRGVREAATGTFKEPVAGKVYAAGLDLAKVEDFTVLTVMNREYQVVHVDRFHRLDWNLQVNRIQATLRRYNRASVLVDTTGAGEPVYESMCRAGIDVEPYAFTSKSKAALIDNLSILFEQRSITLPKVEVCSDLVDELEAFEFSVTEQGHVRTSAPSGIHDDMVVSLALAAWHVRNAPGPLEFRTFNDWNAMQRYLAGYG